MSTNKKANIITAALLAIAGITNAIVIAIMIPLSKNSTAANMQTTSLRVTVKDANTDRAIKGATVCIPEINSYFSTDADGGTGHIEVPYYINHQYDEMIPRPWGDITILVYKKGYIDFIVFYIMVKPNGTRMGPTVSLYPSDDPNNDDLQSLIESPAEDWVKAIRDKFKK